MRNLLATLAVALSAYVTAAAAAAVTSAPVSASGGTTTAITASRDGTSYRQTLVAPTGDTVVFQVFEPKRLVAGQTYPLVLHSHGYGGSRMTTPNAFAQKLIDAGYYLISIDERGFGESSGKVRVMSPDYEGQDLVAVLDWAEALPGLRRGADRKMVVGSYGGSYGGMYQFLLMGADPQQRLHILAPDITPHDLTYSLDSGRVIKSGYVAALVAGGEGSPRTTGGLRQDPIIYETLIKGTLSNSINDSGLNLFRYHSVAYFCDGAPPGPQVFIAAQPDPLRVVPRPFPRADVLLTQGFRDTLFNFNDGYANYECLSRLGGDVRLLTHQSGHILPVSLTSVPFPTGGTLEDALDPFYKAVSFPNFQDAGGSRSCGTRKLDDVQFAWLEEKLQNRRSLDAALPSGKNFCLSLAEGDAISTKAVKLGGTEFAIKSTTPQLNSVLGVGGALLGNGAREALLATQTLYTVPAGGAVLAGIPLMKLQFTGLGGIQQPSCAIPALAVGCDPILFLAIGHRRAGTERWDVIDDQLTPLRGFDGHVGRMSGIAERLAEGDEIGLLIYGFHAQYPITWSRDLFVPALTVTGSIQLPLLGPQDIVRQGV